MSMGGVSLVLMLGLINLLLVLFQVSSGKRILKINFSWHRRLGLILLFTAMLHALLAYFSR